MSTPKEIFLELIRPEGQPERQLRQYEALHMCLTDPCNTYLRGNRRRGTTSVDRWGTTILFLRMRPAPCRTRARVSPSARTSCAGARRCMLLILRPPARRDGRPAVLRRAPPAGRTTCWPGSWERASLSSATFSWVLRIRSRTSMRIRTRCTRSSTTSPSTA